MTIVGAPGQVRSVAPSVGLTVDGANLRLNGALWRGVGVNHFSLVLGQIQSPGFGVGLDYAADIAAIRNTWGLRVIRTCAGMFDYASWNAGLGNPLTPIASSTKKQALYAKIDAIVEECERRGVGLIMDLAWSVLGFSQLTYAVYGTTQAPRMLAHKGSNAYTLMEAYITEFVQRYASSPAIYGWAFGNEVMGYLGPEQGTAWLLDGTGTDAIGNPVAYPVWPLKPEGTTYAAADKMSRAEYFAFSRHVVELIQKNDPYGRIVSPGTAMGASFAVGVTSTQTVLADNFTQWQSDRSTDYMPYVVYRAKDYPVVTQHIYPGVGVNSNPSQWYRDTQRDEGQHITDSAAWAAAAGKPFIQEEFGATCYGDIVDGTTFGDTASELTNWNRMVTAIRTCKPALSMAWNYGGASDLPSRSTPVGSGGCYDWMRWTLTDASRSYMLPDLAQLNLDVAV